ncbi:hypothetical protein [Streptomyces sp. NPDC001137]|uniref:hypothetical protein n=1 Tax=Streptomyces sp. NPDC001137 TaxID=3154378 RepID=UPI003328A2AA
MAEPNCEAATTETVQAGTADPAQDVTLEEKERQIMSTIELLPEAAAILTYED